MNVPSWLSHKITIWGEFNKPTVVPLALRYIGIDLAWKTSPPKEQGTGYCVINGEGVVTEIGLLTSDEEIIALAHEDTWIGIDASLIVPAGKMIRNCERTLRSMGMAILPTSRDFYERHYGGCRGEVLAAHLRDRGFEYFGSGNRAFFEVYPHAVLQAVSPGVGASYKKGDKASRKAASVSLLSRLLEWEPRVQLPQRSMPLLVEGVGAADRMDAFMAAVLLYRHGISGGSLSMVLGDCDDGYILLPQGVGRADRREL